jgi:hypothetical protein
MAVVCSVMYTITLLPDLFGFYIYVFFLRCCCTPKNLGRCTRTMRTKKSTNQLTIWLIKTDSFPNIQLLTSKQFVNQTVQSLKIFTLKIDQ